MKFNLLITISLIFNLNFAQQDSAEVIPSEIQEPVDYLEEYDNENGYNTTTKLLEEGISYQDSLTKRKFESDFQQKYQTPEFDYTLTKPRESLWSKIKRKLSEFLSRFIHTNDAKNLNNITLWVLRIIGIAIVGLVLYWLLRFLMSKEGTWFFSRKNKEILPEARTIAENIHEIDFNQLIGQYETEKDYRFAVRYHYLQLLKILTDRNLIQWDEDKTNLDYIDEIKPDLRPDFVQLTHVFDYVWYGEFAVDSETYDKFKLQFNKFKNRI